MKLCLSILKDELSFLSQLHGLGEETFFSRFALYEDNLSYKSDVLIIFDAQSSYKMLELERGATVISRGEPPEELTHAGVSVLWVSEDISMTSLINEVILIFKKYNDLENSLNEAVLEGRGLQTLVDIMHPFIINELNIVDSNHRFIAHSFDWYRNISQSGFEVDTEKEMLPVEVISFFTNNKRWVEVKTMRDVFLYDEGIFANRLLCKNIIPESEFVCRIVLGETELPFRPYDTYLIEFFSHFVRLVYDRNHNLQEARKKNSLADVLRMMLLGHDVEVWRIQHGLSLMRYDENSHFLALCIRPEYGDDSGDTVSYYCENIPKLFLGLTVFEYQEDIVCLVNTDYYDSSAESFLKVFTPYVRDCNFRLGVSEHFVDVESFKDYYTQAEIAVSMGLEKTPAQWVHRFYQYALDYVVKQSSKDIGVKALCSEKILKLYRYDQEHDSGYIDTLACFYRHSLNATETARQLNIHRSTLLYRLKRIEELAGFDFDDTSKNLFYGFSVKLLESIDS